MSSASPASFESSPTPTSSPDHGSGSNPTSNLYLVTFLATLFLLLFISCAIVMRSYFLRRRYQRRLDAAMAAGMLLAPRSQGSKRKRFGLKPRILDAWLVAPATAIKWASIMPLSAQPVFVKRKYRDVSKSTAVQFQLVAASPPSSSSAPPLFTPALTPPPGLSAEARTPSPAGRLPHYFLLNRRRQQQPTGAATALDADTDADIDNEPDNEGGGPELLLGEASPPASPISPTSPSPIPASLFLALAGGASAAAASSSTATTPKLPAAAAPPPTTTTPTTLKVRVEMLQIAVLIAMPAPGSSRAFPALRKRTKRSRRRRGPTTTITTTGATSNSRTDPESRRRVCSLDEDLDEVLSASSSDEELQSLDDDDSEEEEEEEDEMLPELVFGVTRVNYRQPKAGGAGAGVGAGAGAGAGRATTIADAFGAQGVPWTRAQA